MPYSISSGRIKIVALLVVLMLVAVNIAMIIELRGTRAVPIELTEMISGVGDYPYDRFGWNISYAGDLNADGYDDLIVGLPFYDKLRFDVDGVVTSNPSTGGDSAYSIAMDACHIYVVGTDSSTSGGDIQWRIEKRDKASGALVPEFDLDGVVESNPSTLHDDAYAIAVDTNYIYIAGSDYSPGNQQWRIEKRDKTTGELVAEFDADGIVESNPSTLHDDAYAIAVDTNYIYIAGSDYSPGNTQWRIEKRDKTTGELVEEFDTDGVVESNPSTTHDAAFSITIDTSYIYVTGYDYSPGNTQWRIEKRDKATGVLVSEFNGNGIVESNPSDSFDTPYAIAIDANYLYVVGDDRTVSFNDPKWRIEKRDKITGELVAEFDQDGVVESNPSTGADSPRCIAVDSSYIYVAGYDSTPGNMQWRIEKRDKTTGELLAEFDADGAIESDPSVYDDPALSIAADLGYIYIAGFDILPGNHQWRIEKRDKITGALIADLNDIGAAYVFFGYPGCENTELSAATANLTLIGDVPGALFGWSLTGGGDVNGDGYDDIIIGAPGADKAYVYYGSSIMEPYQAGFHNAGFEADISAQYDWTYIESNDDDSPTTGKYRGEHFAFWSTEGLWSYRLWNLYGATIAEGDWIAVSQLVDLTAVTKITFDLRAVTGSTGYWECFRYRVYVDDDLVYDRPQVAYENAVYLNEETADLSSYTGEHTVSFVLYADATYSGSDLDTRNMYIDNIRPVYKTADLTLTGPTGSRFGSAVAIAGDVDNANYDDFIIGAPSYTHTKYQGLTGSYYDDDTSTVLFCMQVDTTINFAWNNNVPAYGMVNDGTYSIEWEGYVYFPEDTVTFYAYADDESYLWIDDVQYIADTTWDTWVSSGALNLGKGYHHLRYKTVNTGGAGDAYLAWSEAGESLNPEASTSASTNFPEGAAIVPSDKIYRVVDFGAAYIYRGDGDNLRDGLLYGTEPFGKFGSAVASGGDMNNDGYAELVVGAPGCARAYVYYGGSAISDIGYRHHVESTYAEFNAEGTTKVHVATTNIDDGELRLAEFGGDYKLMTVYFDSTAGSTPRYRIGTQDSWLSEANAANVGGFPIWIELRANPVNAYEKILCTLNCDECIHVQVWNGSNSSWTPALELTNTAALTERCFDIAYESLSGRAIVVYYNGTPIPSYRIWNGTEWSEPQITDYTGLGNPRWIRLVSAQDSNEIILVTLNTFYDIYAQVWNGYEWTNSILLEGSAPTYLYQCFDVAYETGTGRAMVVWAEGEEPTARYRIWNGTAWEPEGNAIFVAAADYHPPIHWIRLVSDPRGASSNLALGIVDKGKDLNVGIWNGTSWSTATEVSAGLKTDTKRSFDLAWERFTGRVMVAYGEGNDDLPRYRLWSESDGTWSSEFSALDISPTGGDPEWIRLESDPQANELVLLHLVDGGGGSADDLCVQKWDGSTDSWHSGFLLETASNVDDLCFAVAYTPQVRTKAIVTYLDYDDKDTPRIRYWDQFDWSAEGFMEEFSSSVRYFWVVLESGTVRKSEKILAVHYVSPAKSLYAQVWTGTRWDAFIELAADAPLSAVPHFDIAYETISGDAIVVYEDSDNPILPKYRVWNGTGWSEEAYVEAIGNANIYGILMVSHHQRDEIVLITLDVNETLYAQVWNGSAWGNVILLENNVTTLAYQCFDAVYTEASGSCIVCWGNDEAPNIPQYRSWHHARGWSLEGSAEAIDGTPILHLGLSADPTSDRVLMTILDYSESLNRQIWDGSNWGANEPTTISAISSTQRCFDGAWLVPDTGEVTAVVAYGAADTDAPRWAYWTPTSGWSSEFTALDPNPGTGKPIDVVLESDPNSPSELVLLYIDNDYQSTTDRSDVGVQLMNNLEWVYAKNIETHSYGVRTVKVAYTDTSGYFISAPYDAGTTVFWSALERDMQIPPGTVVKVRTRTGSTLSELSGAKWSEWLETPYLGLPNDNGRYIQYQLWLETADIYVTPIVKSITLRYSQPDIILASDTVDSQFGFTVAGIGDINSDSYDDIIIGAPEAGADNEGEVYIYFGQSGAPPATLPILWEPDIIITGDTGGDRFAYAVSTAQDVDSDTVADILIGAPCYGTGIAPWKGAIYVFTASTLPAEGPAELSASVSASFIAYGESAGDMLGWSVTSVGSFTGSFDYAFIAGSAPHYGTDDVGKVYVFAPPSLLTVTGESYAPSHVTLGDSDVLMLELTLTSSIHPIELTSIKVDRTGNAIDSDISAVKLYEDTNSNGMLDDADLQLSTTETFTEGSCVFDAVSKLIDVATIELLFITISIAADATPEHTVGVALVSSSYIQVSPPDVVASFNAPIESGQATIISVDVLEVTGVSLAPTVVCQNETDVVMEKLTFTSSSNNVTINTIRIYGSGACIADTDILAVRLYEDVNNNDMLDTEDTLLNMYEEETFVNQEACIEVAGLTVIVGTPRHVLIVYDISANATPNATVGVKLVTGYVNVEWPDVVADFGSIESGLATILAVDTLTVAGIDLAPATVYPGDTVVMEKLLLYSNAHEITVSSITLYENGTSTNDTDVAEVKLILDVNSNNTIDDDDILLGTGTFSAQTVTIPFDLTVEAGINYEILVVYDIALTATIGNTLQLLVANNSAITVSYPDLVSTSNFPIESGTTMIIAPNLPPYPPTWILPDSTADKTPTIYWGGALDPELATLTYELQLGTSSGGYDILSWYSVGSNEYYNVTTELAVGNYYVQVKAFDGLQYSTVLEEIMTITEIGNTPPSPPTAIYPNTTYDKTPVITWTGATDVDGDALTYYIRIGTTHAGAEIFDWIYVGEQVAYELTERLYIGTYYVQIKAFDGIEPSAPFEEPMEVLNHPPKAPSCILPHSTAEKMPRIYWEGATDPDPDDTVSYYIQIGTSSGGNDILTWYYTGENPYYDVEHELAVGTYYVQVKSFDLIAFSEPFEAQLNITQFGNIPPSAPRGILPDTTTDKTPTIQWWGATDANNDTLWYYLRLCKLVAPFGEESISEEVEIISWQNVSSAESYTVPKSYQLELGKYRVYVRAFDGVEYSPTCIELMNVTNTPPSGPTAIYPNETHAVTPLLWWEDANDPDPDDELAYYIQIGRSHSEGDILNWHYVGTSAEYQLTTALEPNMTYWVQLIATDGYDNSTVHAEPLVVLEPYIYAIKLSMDVSELTVFPGTTTSYEVKVANLGTAHDEVTITLSGTLALYASLNKSSVSLAPLEVELVELTLNLPDSVIAGCYNITLFGKSLGGATDKLELPVYVMRRIEFNISLRAIPGELRIPIGGSATCTVIVKNYAMWSDNITLTIRSGDDNLSSDKFASDYCTLESNRIMLKPGEERKLNLTITLPSTVLPGEYELFICAVSQDGVTNTTTIVTVIAYEPEEIEGKAPRRGEFLPAGLFWLLLLVIIIILSLVIILLILRRRRRMMAKAVAEEKKEREVPPAPKVIVEAEVEYVPEIPPRPGLRRVEKVRRPIKPAKLEIPKLAYEEEEPVYTTVRYPYREKRVEDKRKRVLGDKLKFGVSERRPVEKGEVEVEEKEHLPPSGVDDERSKRRGSVALLPPRVERVIDDTSDKSSTMRDSNRAERIELEESVVKPRKPIKVAKPLGTAIKQPKPLEKPEKLEIRTVLPDEGQKKRGRDELSNLPKRIELIEE